jgi:hypothetical protein
MNNQPSDEALLTFKEAFETVMKQAWSPPPTWFDFTIVVGRKKCECGSEKAKVAGHSTWCPKYEEFSK